MRSIGQTYVSFNDFKQQKDVNERGLIYSYFLKITCIIWIRF